MFLAITLFQFCFGMDETNTIFVGAWSEPVSSADCGSLRARLIIVEGHSPAYQGELPETLVYLEFQNVSTSTGKTLELYFDPNALQCELSDSHGHPLPPSGSGGSGSGPSACWVALPYDSTIRLRASWFGYGTPKNKGLVIPLSQPLVIRSDNTNECYLSGTFAATPSANRPPLTENCLWEGKLTLPKGKISAKKP
jgi:hypothetical protein